MKSPSRIIRFITALGFALTIAGLSILIFPLLYRTSTPEDAKRITAFLILASYTVLPLGISLFVGGLMTLIVRKKKEAKEGEEKNS